MKICENCKYLIYDDENNCTCSEPKFRQATKLEIAKDLIYSELSDYGIDFNDIKIASEDTENDEYEFYFALWGNERNIILRVDEKDNLYILAKDDSCIEIKIETFGPSIKYFWIEILS